MDHPDESDGDAAFRAEARAFLRIHGPAKGGPEDYHAACISGRIDEAEYVERAKAWQRRLADQGWAGITWPKRAWAVMEQAAQPWHQRLRMLGWRAGRGSAAWPGARPR
jgi:hypothetical protein